MYGFGVSMLSISTAKVSWGQPSMAGALSGYAPPALPKSSSTWSGDFRRAGHCATSYRSGSTPSSGFKSRKRAEEGQEPWSGYHGLTQASPGSGSMSAQLSTSPQDPPGSPSASDYASGFHQETTKPIQLPSPTSGELRRPPYASGGIELPWYSSDDTKPHLLIPGRGGVQQVQPGTTSKFLPASSVRTRTGKWVPTTDIEPASS